MGRYDTIVIGAGFAGLAAARELGQRGQNVLVLEGAPRIGGRAWSSRLGDVPIELGGGYVHWSQPHIWADISRYGLSVEERPSYSSTNAMSRTRFWMDGALREGFSKEEAADIKAAFAAYLAPAREVFPAPYAPFQTDAYRAYDSLSAQDRIDALALSPLQRATLERTAGMQCNNAPREGAYLEALRWYALAHFHDETYAASLSRFTVSGGTAALLGGIADDAGADIRLSARVTQVRAETGGAEVSSSAGTFKARHCIVATGVNVWRDIHFSPAMSPEKAALSEEGLSGAGGKVYVRIKGRFEDSRWSAIGCALLSVLPHHVSDDSSVVVAFTNPEHPLPEVSVSTIQREFDRFEAGLEVLEVKHHDWVADALVRGTWGNFRPNQFSRYFQQALEPEGCVCFASSDIAQGWRGFFDGAIESGVRAARQVLAAG